MAELTELLEKGSLFFYRVGICFLQDQRLQAKTFCARTWPPFSDVPYGMYPST